jgi:DNA-binding protein YbaB
VGVGTYEDTSTALTFSGAWTSWADASHSGGSVKYANTTGAGVSLTFTGSSLTLVYVAQFNTGIATVTIDGTPVDQLDMYSAVQQFQRQKTYSTTAASHTVTVTVSGNKNASSGGAYLVFDAFIVSAAPPAVGVGTYEDTSTALTFSGAWTSWADASHSGGSVKYANTTGNSVTLNTTGSSVTLVYVSQYNTGIATVLIDASTVDQLDTYSATQTFQRQKTYAIPAGTHTVTVSVSGNKNPSSSGTYIVFDALIVSNAPPPVGPGAYEDTSGALTFAGTWNSWADAGHSAGSVKYANTTGAGVSLTFAGDAITLTYVAQYNTGIATVMIDGTPVDQLDTYSATQGLQQQQRYTTTNGTHTVSVVVSGNKNAASSASYVVFDNFVVSAPAPYLTLDSEVGDFVGQGQLRQYGASNATFTSTVREPGTFVSLNVSTTGPSWFLDFAAPIGQPLVVGNYLNAQRASFRTGTAPGLDVGGDGRGCNTVSGRFTVYAIEFAPSGSLVHFEATFEEHCEGGPAALRGAIKI